MLNILSYTIAVVLMLIFFGLCIIIHEFGHFIVAKFCGLHIVAFSVGFKKIWYKKINGVEYRIGCLPIGGYVDLPQIDASDDKIEDENGNELPRANPWARMATAFAGPFFNILFGLFLGVFVWIFGLPQDSAKYSEFTVKSVPENCPEYEAGLRVGDKIVSLNGHDFHQTWADFTRCFMLNEDNVEQITLGVVRGEEKLDIVYTPVVNRDIAPEEDIIYPFFEPEIPILVVPDAGSAAEKAGLKAGDIVLSVDGRILSDPEELLNEVYFSNGKQLQLKVQRGEEILDIAIVPEKYADVEARFYVGINYNPVSEEPIVDGLIPHLPASGILKKGDKILSINGKECKTIEESTGLIKASEDRPCTFEVLRNGEKMTLSITPVKIVPHHIGVEFYMVTHPSPIRQLCDVVEMTWQTLKSLGNSIKSKVGAKSGYSAIGVRNLSGPIGIGRYMIIMFHTSFLRGLYLVVLISYSLGLFNLLPIPVLDGGHIFLSLIEIVCRRPVSSKILKPVTIFFVTLLIAFMVIVSGFDAWKILPSKLTKMFSGSSKDEAKTEQTDTAGAMRPDEPVTIDLTQPAPGQQPQTQGVENAVAP